MGLGPGVPRRTAYVKALGQEGASSVWEWVGEEAGERAGMGSDLWVREWLEIGAEQHGVQSEGRNQRLSQAPAMHCPTGGSTSRRFPSTAEETGGRESETGVHGPLIH